MAAIAAPIETTSDAAERELESSMRLVDPGARILSVSECKTDHTTLRRIIDDTPWKMTTAASCKEALQKLYDTYPLVVFSDSSLPDGTWKDVLDAIWHFEAPHSLLVVTSRLADEGLWSEVLHLGGYDVLSKPLVHEEVLRVLESVWRRRVQAVPQTRVLRAGS